ncbi:unnamed protein product [Brassica napus]|uniref:(rape) hypothetical protein n=1 Tax=Brassica napus TaxID=3708 RepID=A0A816RNB1_BRANA|nr:unnamed protein product [Brassica napus]
MAFDKSLLCMELCQMMLLGFLICSPLLSFGLPWLISAENIEKGDVGPSRKVWRMR